jgi:hypothetical protein
VGSKYACDLSSYEGKSLAQDSISHHCSSGSVIGFISSESAMDTSLSPLKACSSPAFRLAYVYRFKEDPDGVVHLQRAEQVQGCSSASIDSSVAIDNQIFSDLISTKNVTIEGYHIQVSETTADKPYPIVAIRIFGFTGTNERSKTYFDIQTAVSSRIKI